MSQGNSIFNKNSNTIINLLSHHCGCNSLWFKCSNDDYRIYINYKIHFILHRNRNLREKYFKIELEKVYAVFADVHKTFTWAKLISVTTKETFHQSTGRADDPDSRTSEIRNIQISESADQLPTEMKSEDDTL